MPELHLDSPLADFPGLQPRQLRALERAEITLARDLVTHFPKRYEDRTRFDRFPDDESETAVCVRGEVTRTALKRLGGWRRIFEVTLEEPGGAILTRPIVCRWFNSPWVQKAFATGQEVVIYGKPKRRGQTICIDHPEFEIVETGEEISIHLDRIVPVHRAVEGLSPRVLRSLLFHLLEHLDLSKLAAPVPGRGGDREYADALRTIHFPDTFEALTEARRRLVFAEFFALQLVVASRRASQRSRQRSPHCGEGTLMRRLHENLPFPLTTAQTRTIAEIRQDLQGPHPMNRLLHGDVGSGKTLVALSAMLLTVEAGCQAALMAPTQILAEQHYLTCQRLLAPLGLRIMLRTGARTGSTGVPPVVSGVSPDTSPGPVYHKRDLPHFERPWAKYAVTFSTCDHFELPSAARQIVLDAVLHFAEQRYELFAACVMPDHVHLLLEPMVEKTNPDGGAVFFSLQKILHSIKSYSSHRINKTLERSGRLWQQESFDRMIRSEADLQEKFEYITRNPWTAQVVGPDEEYPFVWFPGSTRRDAGPDRRDACATQERESEPQIVIGTHALLYDTTQFSRLSLAVIDEQHKFGVMQRARMIEKGDAPDMLVMTATPIPRTLTMTLYGDLDVSTLDELPADRGRIVTAVRPEKKLPEITKFLREQLEQGRQAYIVYPLIEESESVSAKAVTEEFEQWRERLAPLPCDLLHGRIDPEEKERVMERFRCGETKALIATTVIEVGIDVPNASLMIIENAERFGLAQLHQLRGRVGRGPHKSYCILIHSQKADLDDGKLATLEATSDGFAIAEADLRLRGPGDLLGTAQSGLPPLKLGDPLAEGDIMLEARQAARALFDDDPKLARPENQRFRQLLVLKNQANFVQVS